MLRQAQHERIWEVQAFLPHPAHPPRGVESVRAQILHADVRHLMLEFCVFPAMTALIPDGRDSARMYGLWKTTCFEAFLQAPGTETYFELNFAPTFAWAAYRFDDYRIGMRDLPVGEPPEIARSQAGADHFFLSAEFDRPPGLEGAISVGLSAVIEEIDGTKSYWALAHPDGPPDFHDPACFVLTLPAPDAA